MTPACRRGRPDKTTQPTTNGRSLSLDIWELELPVPGSQFPVSSFQFPAPSVREFELQMRWPLCFWFSASSGRTRRLRHTQTIPLPFLSFLLRKIVMQREGEQRPTV